MKRTNSRLKANRRARTKAREMERLARVVKGRVSSDREREIATLEREDEVSFQRPAPGIVHCVHRDGEVGVGLSRHAAFSAMQRKRSAKKEGA